VIASITAARRRFGNPTNGPSDTITVNMPLKYAHAADAQVSGSGITLTEPLAKAHEHGAQVASQMPTPGKPNEYTGKR
jgi:hypothetical protein